MGVNFARESQMFAETEVDFIYDGLRIKVDFITEFLFPSGGGYDFHMHSDYEFHYIKEGKGQVFLNGKEYILARGDFYVTGPGVEHKQIADREDPMVEYALKCDLQMDISQVDAGSHSFTEYAYLINTLKYKAAEVVKDRYHLRQLFEKAFIEIRDKRAGFFTEIKNTILDIIIASVRNCEGDGNVDYPIPRRDINRYRMEVIKTFIADNFDRNISCRELAAQLFLSTRQVGRILKQETGFSVHDYILYCRVETVKKLLKDTDYKLGQIAENTGFSSEFHLSSVFKKWVGESPTVYREGNRKSAERTQKISPSKS